jgi:hypothetical protein
MTHRSAGASLEVRRTEPSVDLATVVECLADAVLLPADETNLLARQRRRLFTWQALANSYVLAIDTRAVLSRLTTTSAFNRLKPGTDAGFLRDAPTPRRRVAGHIGGRIVEGTGGQLHKEVARLAGLVNAELELLGVPDSTLALLASAASKQVLDDIGHRVDGKVEDALGGQTRLHRTLLEPVAATQQGRRAEVARTMTAVEEIVGDRADHLEHMLSAVSELLCAHQHSEREIAVALATLRQQMEMPDSQVSRFFDFLEDEALARVRLHVTYRLMDAIAESAGNRLDTAQARDMRVLIAYVRRAQGLFEALGTAGGEDVSVNLANQFGDVADFSMSDEVSLAGFSDCLPIWPQSVAQIFEQQGRVAGQPALRNTVREVSYRFRVNGLVPGSRQTAYTARLGRIRDALLTDSEQTRVRRSLAELIFLAATVPTAEQQLALDQTEAASDALRVARAVAAQLGRGGRQAIGETLSTLEEQAALVDTVRRALLTVLRAGGVVVADRPGGRTWDYFVNVSRQLVNLDRIAYSLDRPLAIEEAPSREIIAFFRSIRITPDAGLPSSLFSLPVRVRPGERSLMSSGQTATGRVARVLPSKLVQVIWRPYATSPAAEQSTKSPVGPAADAWQAPAIVELQYELATIGRNQDRTDRRRDPEQTEHLLAAFRTAFAVLSYVALQRVLVAVRRAAGLKERSELSVSMLRLHAERTNPGPFSGPPALFAAAQAVETALARDFDLRMQGLVLEEAMSADKSRGVFHALFTGFPLVIERRAPPTHPMEQTLGLVTFGSRPCTSTPDAPEQPGDNLFNVRTYLAESVDDPFAGFRVRCDAVCTEVREARDGEAVPPTVAEEIRRLYGLGCRHVLLLAHRYGGRHVGGSVRYRLHDRANTLAALTASCPDLYVYPIVRDAFPATRMRMRDASAEDAFEILAPDEHLSPGAPGDELHRDYTPVYSLATMYVVGEASRPQSGVCTYFLLRENQPTSIEQAERLRANLLIADGAMAGVRGDLIALLRGLHYLEAERPPTRDGYFQPVLDPYSWLAPDSHGNAGEVVVRTSRRRAGTVVLSLPAVLEHVSRAVHAIPSSGDR